MKFIRTLLAVVLMLSPAMVSAQTETMPPVSEGTSISVRGPSPKAPLSEQMTVNGPISISQQTKTPAQRSGAINDGPKVGDIPSVSAVKPDGTSVRPPNIVSVLVIPAGCGSTFCVRAVQSHNARVDAGAAFVSNQLSNSALASAANLANYIALSTDTAAVVKTDTSCPGEIVGSGLSRALSTWGNYTAPATLNGTATYTMSVSYTATGAYSINKLCLLTQSSGGTLMFETLLGATVSGGNGDTVNVVWTINE